MTTSEQNIQELPGGAELDAALRALVDSPVEFGPGFDGLVERSRVTNRVRLRLEFADLEELDDLCRLLQGGKLPDKATGPRVRTL